MLAIDVHKATEQDWSTPYLEESRQRKSHEIVDGINGNDGLSRISRGNSSLSKNDPGKGNYSTIQQGMEVNLCKLMARRWSHVRPQAQSCKTVQGTVSENLPKHKLETSLAMAEKVFILMSWWVVLWIPSSLDVSVNRELLGVSFGLDLRLKIVGSSPTTPSCLSAQRPPGLSASRWLSHGVVTSNTPRLVCLSRKGAPRHPQIRDV